MSVGQALYLGQCTPYSIPYNKAVRKEMSIQPRLCTFLYNFLGDGFKPPVCGLWARRNAYFPTLLGWYGIGAV